MISWAIDSFLAGHCLGPWLQGWWGEADACPRLAAAGKRSCSAMRHWRRSPITAIWSNQGSSTCPITARNLDLHP